MVFWYFYNIISKVGGASLKAEFADIVISCNQWNINYLFDNI